MQKYFEDIPAFVVYEMLYDMGFWDSQKIVKGLPWKDFIKRFENVTWAGDFFSVDVWTNCGLQTFYTLFFIHLGTQRVFIAGTSNHATSEWVVNMIKDWTAWPEPPFGEDARFLIRDRDRRYTAEVDWYFAQMGMMPKIISPGAPVMNFHAEQFVRKIKHECLSHCIFLSGDALRSVIAAYVEYYNSHRPNSKHNGGCIIEDGTHWQKDGEVKQFGKIPGLTNYYFREGGKKENED
jgi:putative transposase